MCKFKQLILITSLVISGVSNANSERSSSIDENLAKLRQCERVIAPNYVLNPRSELETCIKDNSTEFSETLAIDRRFRTEQLKIIAGLYRAYDDADLAQMQGYIAVGVVIPAACLIVGVLAVEAIKFGSSARS